MILSDIFTGNEAPARMGMGIYSLGLALMLLVGTPWWLWRMAVSGRYREGLGQRLGRVPAVLRAAIGGRRVVWLHAVSVGEVLGAERLVRELGEALPGWMVVVSTTTATGQKVARGRFGAENVFFFPLDFAFAVRRALRALRPEMLVLMESELWPRLLVECERAGVPVAVVNARVSDRSFPRYMRLRRLWRPLLGKVSVMLAQGEESAGRLRRIGARAERVRVVGNLKYDYPEGGGNAMVARLRRLTRGKKLLVAGSTLSGEEKLLIGAWAEVLGDDWRKVLVIAPRHPQRFGEVRKVIGSLPFPYARAKFLATAEYVEFPDGQVLELDTLGDLAAVYQLADVAFVGGSLVRKGGHNPLEAARFGVPVLMGPSYENFREMVEGMRAADAIRITEAGGLAKALKALLRDDEGMGERGRKFSEGQAGATGRTVEALLELLRAEGRLPGLEEERRVVAGERTL